MQKILKNLSRVKFSEGAFGQLSPESECVICMQSYGDNDMITTLACNEKHFFHTQCIERWIQNRPTNVGDGPKCPICRAPISVEDKRASMVISDKPDRRSQRASLISNREQL